MIKSSTAVVVFRPLSPLWLLIITAIDRQQRLCHLFVQLLRLVGLMQREVVSLERPYILR